MERGQIGVKFSNRWIYIKSKYEKLLNFKITLFIQQLSAFYFFPVRHTEPIFSLNSNFWMLFNTELRPVQNFKIARRSSQQPDELNDKIIYEGAEKLQDWKMRFVRIMSRDSKETVYRELLFARLLSNFTWFSDETSQIAHQFDACVMIRISANMLKLEEALIFDSLWAVLLLCVHRRECFWFVTP